MLIGQQYIEGGELSIMNDMRVAVKMGDRRRRAHCYAHNLFNSGNAGGAGALSADAPAPLQ